MLRPNATAAPSAEPAARIEYASRRQPRPNAAASEEGFAAILDRTSAQRSEALRQLRQVNETGADSIAAKTTEPGIESIAGASSKESDAAHSWTQPTKPQRPAVRDGDRQRGGEGDADATPAATRNVESVAATRLDTFADTTTQAPAVAQPDSVIMQSASAIVAVVHAPAIASPIIASQAAAPQTGIGGPTPPASVAPIAKPPATDAAPPPPMGPGTPAELALPVPAPIAGAVPELPRTEIAAPPRQPLAPEPPPPQSAPAAATPVPADVARRPNAVAKTPVPDAGPVANQPADPLAAAAPQVAAPAVAPAAAPDTPPRTENNPGAAIVAARLAAVAFPEATQLQRSPPLKTDETVVAGHAAEDDVTIDLPLLATATRATAAGEDAGSAARGTMSRGGTSTTTAFAAQLAQHEDGAQPATPPAAQTVVPTTIAVVGSGDDPATTKTPKAQDEIAPVRHTIAVAPEVATTRIESTTETLATRAARMPMHPAVAQVAVSVTKAAQEGVDRITIKLQPPELGRIDVRLEVGVDGRIQAVFAAERPATVEILQRDVRELERALQSAGLSTDAGSLSFGLKQNGGQNGHAFAAFERNLGAGLTAAADDEPVPATTPGRAAVDGRLDIHV